MPKYAAKRGKQTGSKNTKTIGGRQKATRVVNPWGPIVPNRNIGHTNGIGQSIKNIYGRVRGSATRKPVPASELKGMQYPANDPGKWPVEPDFVNHTRAPDPYGITPAVEASWNQALENEYHRAGYQ